VKGPTEPLKHLVVTRRTVLRAGTFAAIAAMAPPNAHGQAPARLGDGFRVVRAARGTASLRASPAPASPIWGFDAKVPGPTLRAGRGEEIKVRLVNELDEPTIVHWHGMRIPNAMDGVPVLTQSPVAPGASFDYRFVAPDAGTFWYHAQFDAPRQIGLGLYGALIIDEAEPIDVDRDVALVFGEWRPARGGGVAGVPGASAGEDDTPRGRLTINGLPVLDVPVKTNERVRLRLINAAHARVLALRLERHRAVVMAIDGEPAEPFEARDGRFTLGPGNRIDLFIDTTLEAGASAALIVDDYGADLAIARLVYEAGAPARPQPRADWKPLPPNPLPERIDLERALKLDTTLGVIEAGKPLFSVKRGRGVLLGLVNRGAASCAVHVHGHHFRLLDRMDDGWKPFWLDTVVVPNGQTFRIAFVADNPGKWLIQGTALAEGERPSAQWFEVT
jgi:FtsP/CotA-like multicopper oxidase with cupredoxin domain